MIALILARSGSKGIPNKNILKLGNIRISHYSIKAALESSKIDMTVYSSDSNQYIELAKQFVTENFQSKKNTFLKITKDQLRLQVTIFQLGIQP